MIFLLRCILVFYLNLVCHGYVVSQETEIDPLEYMKKSGRRIDHTSVIIGAPSDPSHLPEAEPILPGHTLIRPTLGMLKSSIKFPHKELEDGAGVYGNIDSLGIRYNGKGGRVMYSGFRRNSELQSKPNIEDLLRRLNTIRTIEEKIQNESQKTNEHEFSLPKEFNLPNNLKYENIDQTLKENGKDDDNLLGQVVLKNAQKTTQKDNSLWYWNNNDQFNHIKFKQNALEYKELIPTIDSNLENIRSWWFYHQADLTHLDEDIQKD